MYQPPFLIGEALRFGWQKTRLYSGVFFPVVLTLFGLQVAHEMVQKLFTETLSGVVLSALLSVVAIVCGIGAVRIGFLVAQGQPPRYSDLLPPVKILWPYIGASVLTLLAVIGGLILLIIPGIWAALRLSMVRFEVLEGAGMKASLDKSWALTEGHVKQLALFFGAVVLLNLIGALLLFVGLLVTIPMTLVAHGYVYLKLKNKA